MRETKRTLRLDEDPTQLTRLNIWTTKSLSSHLSRGIKGKDKCTNFVGDIGNIHITTKRNKYCFCSLRKETNEYLFDEVISRVCTFDGVLLAVGTLRHRPRRVTGWVEKGPPETAEED